MDLYQDRGLLFKKVINEIYNFEQKNCDQLLILNNSLKNFETEHTKKQDPKEKNTPNNSDPSIEETLTRNIQILISFYSNKYTIISQTVGDLKKQVDKLNEIKTEKSDYKNLIESFKSNFDLSHTRIEICQKEYYQLMKQLETKTYDIISEAEKKYNYGPIQEINEIENQLKIPELLIESAKDAKKNYIIALDEIKTNMSEVYKNAKEMTNINKNNTSTESDISFNVLKIFNDTYLMLDSLIQGMFMSTQKNYGNIIKANENKTILDDININLGFIEYSPQYKNYRENKELLTLFVLNKFTDFDIESCFKDGKDKKQIKFLFILEKIMNYNEKIENEDIELFKNSLNDKKNIKKFLEKLNKNRMNSLIPNKKLFDLFIDLLKLILPKIDFKSNEDHELIRFILILSETYYMNDEKNEKIYFVNGINSYKEFKNVDFWIKYIELEIEIDSLKNVENNKKSDKIHKSVFISFISNLTNVNEFLCDKNKINQVINYFKEKYKFTDENMKTVHEEINIEL